jgi:predicted metalloprotease with PDZ domain
MKWPVLAAATLLAAQAAAETHVGFEARIDKDSNLIRISEFYAASRARGSGLGTGDVLVAIDRVQIKHPNTIHRYAKRKKPGEVVTITVNRNYRLVEKKVVLVDGDEARESGTLGYIGGR